eukprot:4782516-Prymnesium_polylepis.2
MDQHARARHSGSLHLRSTDHPLTVATVQRAGPVGARVVGLRLADEVRRRLDADAVLQRAEVGEQDDGVRPRNPGTAGREREHPWQSRPWERLDALAARRPLERHTGARRSLAEKRLLLLGSRHSAAAAGRLASASCYPFAKSATQNGEVGIPTQCTCSKRMYMVAEMYSNV